MILILGATVFVLLGCVLLIERIERDHHRWQRDHSQRLDAITRRLDELTHE